jgi:arylsulfatase A-like enzyme
MVEFYDDAILEFDTRFASILSELERRGIDDRTVVVLYSDHGNRKHAGERVPLVIRFPAAEHRGRLNTNAQLVDIAPTILAHLGLETPPWMDGRSLIASPPRAPTDPILVADVATERGGNIGRGVKLRRFNRVTAVYCDRTYTLHLDSRRLQEGAIRDHTAPCGTDALVSAGEAKAAILRKLAELGVGAESLRPQLAPEG